MANPQGLNGGRSRPPLDEVVYKIRFRKEDGRTETTYYSDPKIAGAMVAQLRSAGSLLYYGSFRFERDLT